MKGVKSFLGMAALALVAACGEANDNGPSNDVCAEGAFCPALAYDLGGKFDKSFNEAAWTGAQRYKDESGLAYVEFEPTNEAQAEQALRRFAQRGHALVIAVGVNYETALRHVAQEFPDVHFTLIDAQVDLPNVQSVLFTEEEGSYLVGVLAAMKSETGTIGFIGGMDIPLIRKFAAGYEAGAKSVNSDIKVYRQMVGTTPAAWNDPIKGGELARSQYARGADVIFSAAGPTGTGVLQAAKDTGKLAIGVDSNQNHLQPGSVLTSMLKRVDVAVYDAMTQAQSGKWQPGVKVLNLAADGVAYSVDEYNKALLSDEMIDAAEKARAAIISGEVEVPTTLNQ
ncbi:MAG: BMP family ABC transporter substrate-binding protein [Sphingomonadales bacterium]